jgi:hypothetical protein
LRDMQYAIRTAFNVLEEKPLIIRTGNWRRDALLYCRKSQAIQMRESQPDMRFYRDFLITLRASNPRILSYQQYADDSAFFFVDHFISDTSDDYSEDPYLVGMSLVHEGMIS